MTIFHEVTGNVRTLAGVPTSKRARVMVISSVPKPGIIVDTDGDQLLVGDMEVQVDAATGDFTIPGLIDYNDVDTQPFHVKYMVFISYPVVSVQGTTTTAVWDSGWLMITEDADLADPSLLPGQYSPPEWQSGFMAQANALLSSKVAEAEAIRQYVNDVSNIALPDSVITAIDSNPASAFRQQQDARLSTSIAAQLGDVADPDNVAEFLTEAAAEAAVDDLLADNATLGVIAKRGRWPVVTITTDGAAPVVSKDTYVNGSYTITDTDTGLIHSGRLKIKGRGNTTWGAPKKPFRLNLDTATALLGMTATQKNWALLANYYDPAKINNAFALHYAQQMTGLDWTPQYRYVEVVLNGAYLGIYQLADLVRMEAGRLALTSATGTAGPALTGAYLLEIDSRAAAEGTAHFTTTHGVMVAYDTPEAPNTEQVAYISDFVQDFEDALFGASFTDPVSGYAPFIDRDSFIDWYLINELTSNTDSNFTSSCKLYKARNTDVVGRLYMGPVWDFDLSLGVRGTGPDASPYEYRTRAASWFARLFADPTFATAAAVRWSLLTALLADYPAWIDQNVDQLSPAIERDDRKWAATTYAPQQADARKTWLNQRINWLASRAGSWAATYPSTYPSTY